jgi:hypothetical protein
VLNAIAEQNIWQGAYAELSALDFLDHPLANHAGFLTKPVEIGVEPVGRKLLGKHSCGGFGLPTLDGWFSDFDVYFDVKVLMRSSQDILQRVYERIRSRCPNRNVLLGAEFLSDTAEAMLPGRVSAIEQELRDALDQDPNTTFVRSTVVEGLAHRISRTGCLVTEDSHDPYCDAERLWSSVLRDCHQFVADRPFLLVFVTFPWYGSEVTQFRDLNKILYRAMSRRVFCGLKGDCRWVVGSGIAKEAARLEGTTLADASRSLSGILFLEDRSIKLEDNTSSNTCGYLFTNPNASNNLTRTLFWDYACCDLRLIERDSFEFDNY